MGQEIFVDGYQGEPHAKLELVQIQSLVPVPLIVQLISQLVSLMDRNVQIALLAVLLIYRLKQDAMQSEIQVANPVDILLDQLVVISNVAIKFHLRMLLTADYISIPVLLMEVLANRLLYVPPMLWVLLQHAY